MFETVAETFDDIRDSIGDKGFYIIIALAAAFGLYNLSKGKQDNSAELTPVTSVSSYPDSVTNANVIIDTLQNSIDYSEGVIVEKIEALDNDISVNFEATNDYIHKGLEQATQINDKVSTIGNITAATYYETMLHQGRDGYISYSPEQALSVLENMGFDTSKESGTDNAGRDTGKAGSKGGGWTTFKGDNIEKAEEK